MPLARCATSSAGSRCLQCAALPARRHGPARGGAPKFTHPEEMARMTENYPTGTTPPPYGEWPEAEPEQDTTQVVKDQASDLANSGVQAGKHVGDVAREQASGVAAEAGRQGRNLLDQAQGQLHEQASEGQQRIAKKLLSLSDELRSMAENSNQGVAVDVAQQAASRVRDAGHWLEKREPGQVVNEVQSFARRRPARVPGACGRSGPGGRAPHPGAERCDGRRLHAHGRTDDHAGAWHAAGPASWLTWLPIRRTARASPWSLTTRLSTGTRCDPPGRAGRAAL